MLCYFEIFTICQESMRTFSKHYSKCKTVSTMFRKTLQEWRLPTFKTFNFFTSKRIFITLQYSGDILGIIMKQTFVECSSNVLETILCDYWNLPKDQHFLLSNQTLLTQKQLFHRELFKNLLL